MVEIELVGTGSQCLNRRIPQLDTMKQEIATWQQQRNHQHAIVNWRFTWMQG